MHSTNTTSITVIFLRLATLGFLLLCSLCFVHWFESGILMTTLWKQILYVEEVAFFQVIFNLISTVPSLSTLGTRKTIPAETLDFYWLYKYLTDGNVMESGSFVNERSILPGAQNLLKKERTHDRCWVNLEIRKRWEILSLCAVLGNHTLHEAVSYTHLRAH